MQRYYETSTDTTVGPVFASVANPASSDLDFSILSEYLWEEGDMQDSTKLLNITESVELNCFLSPDHEISSGGGSEEGLKVRSGTMKNDRIARKRERNRLLARKIRLRKKFHYESLQQTYLQLAEENRKLKAIICEKIPEHREEIFARCRNVDLGFMTANASLSSAANMDVSDFALMKVISAAQRSFLITDPALHDNPIIYASNGFLELTGYNLESVLGRNCRFLQCEDTDPQQVAVLREGILAGRDTSVCLLNRRADGSLFYNQIFVAALRNANHEIVNFVGVQVEVLACIL